MAQYAAAKTNATAITFNSVGIPEELIGDGCGARAFHYMTRYDWVANMSGSKRNAASGISGPLATLRGIKQTLLGKTSDIHILRSTRNRYKILDMHSLDAVKQGLVLEPKIIPRPFEECQVSGSLTSKRQDISFQAGLSEGLPKVRGGGGSNAMSQGRGRV